MIASPIASRRWHDIRRLCPHPKLEVAAEHPLEVYHAKVNEHLQKSHQHSKLADEHSDMAGLLGLSLQFCI